MRQLIRIQQEFLSLMTMSKSLNSCSQCHNNFCKHVTEGDINKISSAYKMTNTFSRGLCNLVISSMYTEKRYGDSTKPCLTPKHALKTRNKLLFHLTHIYESENQSTIRCNNFSGIFRFINNREHYD